MTTGKRSRKSLLAKNLTSITKAQRIEACFKLFCRSLAKATIGFTYDNSVTGDSEKDDADSESDSDSVLSDIGKNSINFITRHRAQTHWAIFCLFCEKSVTRMLRQVRPVIFRSTKFCQGLPNFKDAVVLPQSRTNFCQA